MYRANAEPPDATVQGDTHPVPGASTAALPEVGAFKLDGPLVEIAETSTPGYLDTAVQQEKTYAYAVRSAVQVPAKVVESADSNISVITLHDVFPPSMPTGLLVAPVPAGPGTPAYLDLSWDINPETDMGGYNVYRSEGGGAPGARLNAELLPTPTFRDMTLMPGRRYFYTVTAVDRAGNESSASAPVEGGLPAESP